jgi:hypothetical protein
MGRYRMFMERRADTDRTAGIVLSYVAKRLPMLTGCLVAMIHHSNMGRRRLTCRHRTVMHPAVTAHTPNMVLNRQVMGRHRTLMDRRPAMIHVSSTVNPHLMGHRRMLTEPYPAMARRPPSSGRLRTLTNRDRRQLRNRTPGVRFRGASGR